MSEKGHKTRCVCCEGSGRVNSAPRLVRYPGWEDFAYTVPGKVNVECANCRGRGYVWRKDRK